MESCKIRNHLVGPKTYGMRHPVLVFKYALRVSSACLYFWISLPKKVASKDRRRTKQVIQQATE